MPKVKKIQNSVETAFPTEAKVAASVPAKEMNPDRAAAILAECERQGLTLSHLVDTIKRATVATRTTVDKYGQEAVTEEHTVQLKAAMAGLEIRGDIKAKDNGGDNVYNFLDVKALVQQWNSIPDSDVKIEK